MSALYKVRADKTSLTGQMSTTVTGKNMTKIFLSTPKFIRIELAKNGPDTPKIIVLSPI